MTVFQGLKKQNPNTTFTAGCTVKNTEPPANTPADVCGDDSGFAAAIAASKGADQVVLALGETREQSGEAASRSELDCGRQLEGGTDQVVPGHGLTATATSRVSTPNGDPSRSP